MKKIVCILTLAAILSGMAVSAGAVPYENYAYDRDGIAQAEPQAYMPVGTVTGESLGIGTFQSPKDVFVTADEQIFIADSGNNRVVVIDHEYQLVRVVDSFVNNGAADKFSNPSGVFVDSRNHLYVADTDNERIVALNEDGSVYRILGRPQSNLLTDSDFRYAPIRVAVDSAERVYIVSRNVNQGMIELNAKGEFWGFYGAIQTVPDMLLIMQKMLATKAQREQMQLTVPTEYSACDLDDKDFVYGTVSAVGTKNIDTTMFTHRLNPMGVDVLKRNGFFDPMGDVNYRRDLLEGDIQPSQLCDIAVRDSEMYAVLDSRMGRVFTYNSNGDLMYVFGAIGDSLGQFGTPEALDTMGETYLVADSKYNRIVTFKPTEYGRYMTQAVRSYYQRDYEETDRLWEQILQFTSKSDLAFKGMGLSLIKKGEYKEAMNYLKLAGDKRNYSIAQRHYRAQVINEHFTTIMLGILAIPVLYIVIRLLLHRRKKKGGIRK